MDAIFPWMQHITLMFTLLKCRWPSAFSTHNACVLRPSIFSFPSCKFMGHCSEDYADLERLGYFPVWAHFPSPFS